MATLAMSIDITDWLRKLGLEQHATAFRDNAIDARVLPSLTAEDLRDLGVNLVGHRRRLLDAIAALSADVPATVVTATSRDVPTPADAERRQLTVMFCDLVGSTALSTQFDPEDLRELIGAYHRAVTAVVVGFDGFVAKGGFNRSTQHPSLLIWHVGTVCIWRDMHGHGSRGSRRLSSGSAESAANR